MQRVLYPHLSTYWSNLQVVLDDYSVSNAQVKADGHKVYGAILVSLSGTEATPARGLSQVLMGLSGTAATSAGGGDF